MAQKRGKSRNNRSKKKIRLMTEDAMQLIFSNLSVKDLFRSETVSQQFKYVVNEVLKRQKCLVIGEFDHLIIECSDGISKQLMISGNITNALVTKKVNSTENRNNLKSILNKCVNIKFLYLNESLDFKTLEMIAKNCKKLECLSFDKDFINSSSRLRGTDSLFPKINHLYLKNYWFDYN
jgi:hypothetical protein